MKHNFQATEADPIHCGVCARLAVDHGPYATCEVCNKQRECNVIDDILTCHFCENWQKNATRQEQELHARQLEVKKAFKEIDNSIKIQTDIFNAKTVAIHEMKLAIDADTAIENKAFTLAQVIEKRFNHLKEIIFSKRQEITEAENEQKAIQVYYNELAKKLRTEEREKIRLKDAQYQPAEVVIKKPRAVVPKKFDKDSIRAASRDSGVNEAIIRMLCIAKNLTPVEAVRQFKEAQSIVE